MTGFEKFGAITMIALVGGLVAIAINSNKSQEKKEVETAKIKANAEKERLEKEVEALKIKANMSKEQLEALRSHPQETKAEVVANDEANSSATIQVKHVNPTIDFAKTPSTPYTLNREVEGVNVLNTPVGKFRKVVGYNIQENQLDLNEYHFMQYAALKSYYELEMTRAEQEKTALLAKIDRFQNEKNELRIEVGQKAAEIRRIKQQLQEQQQEPKQYPPVVQNRKQQRNATKRR